MMKARLRLLSGAVLALLSASCNRDVGGDLAHAATPQPDGRGCVADVECASEACSEGMCVAPATGLVEIDGDCSGGGACVGDATCEDGICVEKSDSCIPDGEGLAVEACGADSDCCSGHCNQACRKATCGGVGAPCATWKDCCDADCDVNGGRCSNSCSPSGFACGGQDCCGGGPCPATGQCP